MDFSLKDLVGGGRPGSGGGPGYMGSQEPVGDSRIVEPRARTYPLTMDEFGQQFDGGPQWEEMSTAEKYTQALKVAKFLLKNNPEMLKELYQQGYRGLSIYPPTMGPAYAVRPYELEIPEEYGAKAQNPNMPDMRFMKRW